ncbi:B12-binding domain-containing radical SAM protein [Leucothrix pacifica]
MKVEVTARKSQLHDKVRSMNQIVLTTLNARYIHAAFGLRYIFANLAELQAQTVVREFTIHETALNIAEKILAEQPKIVGISVYIWNVSEVTELVGVLKQISPELVIVLGGPEVSHPPDLPAVCELADYVVTGAGEKSFYDLCTQLLQRQTPLNRMIEGVSVPLPQLASPYQYYDAEDIQNRICYVEASRGCPFKCEFCLSALDKTAKPFELGAFLDEMDNLYQKGARNFKFIDRTFNLKVKTSVAILEFFLARMDDELYLHFEVIPDNLPDDLKEVLKRFPDNRLQFEIGVQTFDPEIQELISRRQDNQKTIENLRWLREHTGAHLHTDLIFGLPGDTLENFAESFDQLVALNPQEIQLGILKRLRGAPINRHTDEYQLRYNPVPPYNILSTRDISFSDMQRVNRFARYWDMIGNSGRFKITLPTILGDRPFERFLTLSDALFNASGSTWKIALKRLFELVYEVMVGTLLVDSEQSQTVLREDFLRSELKGRLAFEETKPLTKQKVGKGIANKRQKMHQ